MGSFLSIRIGLFYFSLCQKCSALTKVFSSCQKKGEGGEIGMAQLIIHLVENGSFLSFQNYCDSHLSTPQMDTATCCWMGVGRTLFQVYARAFPRGAPLGTRRATPTLECAPIYLPQKLTISSAQSSSHTFYRSRCFYSRKQVIWRLHYFYDEKRALEVKYTHAYNKHAQPQPQSCI